MGVSIGGINLGEGLIDAQYRISVLEKILDHVIPRLAPGVITTQDLQRFRDEAFADLQKRYPGAGIQRK